MLLVTGAIVNVAVAWGCAARWENESRMGATDSSVFRCNSYFLEVSAGLPYRALGGSIKQSFMNPIETGGLWLARPWPFREELRLPYNVIWPGFAINTMFYAAMLWMVFALPSWLSRKRRNRHGKCPACAYPIGVSPVCTECGAELKVPSLRK